jgi:hypothetical protein
MSNLKCKLCNKPIAGSVKLVTSRKRSGNKVLSIVDYYDETCFKSLTKAKALNGISNQKRTNKKTNTRRA